MTPATAQSGSWVPRAFLLGAALAALPATIFAQAGEDHSQAVDDRQTMDIVEKMVQSENTQDKHLRQYRMSRTYRLRSEDGAKDVKMLARVDYDSVSGKRIQVLEEEGSEGLFRRALRKVLEAEVRTSHQDGRAETALTPDNYHFHLAGSETHDGHRCYVLQLVPKRKSKYLIEGRAWVSAEDYGLVAIEGRPSASVSFWVGKPLISQSFEKVGDYWLLAQNRSVVDAKLVGRIELRFETRDVEVGGTKVALMQRHNHSNVD
jgi:hypothetical protein